MSFKYEYWLHIAGRIEMFDKYQSLEELRNEMKKYVPPSQRKYVDHIADFKEGDLGKMSEERETQNRTRQKFTVGAIRTEAVE